jgi:hypothetical protein
VRSRSCAGSTYRPHPGRLAAWPESWSVPHRSLRSLRRGRGAIRRPAGRWPPPMPSRRGCRPPRAASWRTARSHRDGSTRLSPPAHRMTYFRTSHKGRTTVPAVQAQGPSALTVSPARCASRHRSQPPKRRSRGAAGEACSRPSARGRSAAPRQAERAAGGQPSRRPTCFRELSAPRDRVRTAAHDAGLSALSRPPPSCRTRLCRSLPRSGPYCRTSRLHSAPMRSA